MSRVMCRAMVRKAIILRGIAHGLGGLLPQSWLTSTDRQAKVTTTPVEQKAPHFTG